MIIMAFLPQNNITLLAYEDPSLKGYYESRERYVSDKFYKQLFNSIGESRASIVRNGEVIGIWSWDKKQKKIEKTIFIDYSLSIEEEKQLCNKIELAEECLKNEKTKQFSIF